MKFLASFGEGGSLQSESRTLEGDSLIASSTAAVAACAQGTVQLVYLKVRPFTEC